MLTILTLTLSSGEVLSLITELWKQGLSVLDLYTIVISASLYVFISILFTSIVSFLSHLQE